MIDSVALVWGDSLGTAPRRARGVAEPVSPPLRLDVAELHQRLAGEDGQLTAKRYGADGAPFVAGHWQAGDVDVLYSDGRLELRASLPKIVTGGTNAAILDERGVHEGLCELARRGSELVQHPLALREAVPTRLDPVVQWEVPSVAFVVEHLRAAFSPARKLRTEWISPLGGRSLVWGYGSKRVLRFYDKGADVAEKLVKELGHGIPAEELEAMDQLTRRRAIRAARQRVREQVWQEANVDRILRFELQDRHRPRLRLIHENGYRACDVRGELERAVAALGAVAGRDFAGLLDSYATSDVHRVAYAAASLHFATHEADLAVVRTRVSQRTYYAWRRRARRAALAVGDWQPTIPSDAFEAGSSLWSVERLEAA